MKKLALNYRERQKRIARDRDRARLRGRPEAESPRRRSKKASRPFDVYAPKFVSILDQGWHYEVMKFVRVLRKEAIRHSRIEINFKHTVQVHSCGMLLVLAETDRLVRALAGRCEISCTYPAEQKVEKVLQQIGFLKLLNKPHRLEITEDDRDVFHWKFASGTAVAPSEADPILKGIKDQIPKTFRKIVVGVEEAMDNAVHHGYLESREDRVSRLFPGCDERRWWLFAEVLDEWLHVVFCDLGIGISRSLPRSWSEEVGDIVRLTMSKGTRDVRMIARAFEVGRTRTKKGHRGKGLKNIAMAAKELGGVLTVHSNAGSMRYDYREDKHSQEPRSYRRSIMGTLVQWSIPLAKKQVGK
ncbi:ATP-binding protein [Pseudomonas nitroreducens]|uniref:ATP-binding protein n=1 Tax=Pseudomonas nitroreducens TaxID=46680 RepID=A0A6G6J354_PSENT|nr:ATP-binding protein [Pseudomonas nitroreducens]QIE89490.1 ATP-binding protein [Pseudomonas nitroreducens]